MKSERRHKLHQNELHILCANFIEQFKPYLVLGILSLVLLVVVVAGWLFWGHQSTAQAGIAWNDLFNAINSGSPAEVKEVAEQRLGSNTGHWAAVVAGDMYLSTGCGQLFSSKATAVQELRKAVDQYMSVREQSRSSALRERATFGLARAYESLAGTRQSEGELKKAEQYYQEVVQTWPDGVYAMIATRQLEDLQRKETKIFYDKFAQYDPQPTYYDQPDTSEPSPDFNLDSLDPGNITDFSKVIGMDDPADSTDAESTDAESTDTDSTSAEPDKDASATDTPDAGKGAPSTPPSTDTEMPSDDSTAPEATATPSS